MSSTVPANPFAGEVVQAPVIRNYINRRVVPLAVNNDVSDEEMSYRILKVNHIYVGGIANLFDGAGHIYTEDFIKDDGTNSGNYGGGFGGGGYGNGNYGGGLGTTGGFGNNGLAGGFGNNFGGGFPNNGFGNNGYSNNNGFGGGFGY